MEREKLPREQEIVDVRIKREEEFPTDPEKRFEAVFSAIGNSEAKCLTLLCLSQTPLSRWELYKRFLNESGGVWQPHSNTTTGYCINTLIPIGLVVEADFIHYGTTDHITGFRLTEAGLKYGRPIAAFLLQKSAQSPHSLLKIFGQTSKCSGETRSILNRVKILEVLTKQNNDLRTTDIAQKIETNESSVGDHLTYFENLGLVEYQSVDSEKSYVKYQILEKAKKEDVKSVRKSKKLTGEVSDLLFRLKVCDASSLADILKAKYPKRPIKFLTSHISKVLSDLVKQGICQRERFEGRKIHSKAKISPLGQKMFEDIILPIKKALSGDEELLSQWKRLRWQSYTGQVISKYKEASGNANRRPLEEWTEETFLIIAKNPGIRPKEIESLLGHNPIEPLRILLAGGKVKSVREGKTVHYYPVETIK